MVKVRCNVELVELTSKAEVKQAQLEGNEWKYHQTEGFSQLLLWGQLLADIVLLGTSPHVDNILNGSYVVSCQKALHLVLSYIYLHG